MTARNRLADNPEQMGDGRKDCGHPGKTGNPRQEGLQPYLAAYLKPKRHSTCCNFSHYREIPPGASERGGARELQSDG